jgi:hypothetical protein
MKNTDKRANFSRSELDPILLKYGFKINEDKIIIDKVYYNKTKTTSIYYDYGYLKFFFKDYQVGQLHSDYGFFKLYLFYLNLDKNSKSFLDRNLGYPSKYLLQNIKSFSELEEKLKKEINDINTIIKLSLEVYGEKAKTKKCTNQLNYYQKILNQLTEFEM